MKRHQILPIQNHVTKRENGKTAIVCQDSHCAHFDLKTISGKTIVESQLLSSIGQSNRALLNMTADYNPSLLARSIKKYFERNDEALEVLIFKGKKSISVSRDLTLSPDYYRIFMRRYVK